MRHRTRLSAVAVIACVAACARQDQTKAAPATAGTAAPASTPSAPNQVTVTARDYAFDAPAELPAGLTTIRLVNNGKELHHVQVIRLEQGKTLEDFLAGMKAGGPPPAWAVFVGGPNAPAPGAESNATIMLQPGNYAFVCFVDVPDHVPHVMKGMSRAFTVTGTVPATVSEPNADVTMTLADYAFTLSTPFTAGTHTVRVENTAAQTHEVELIQLAPGKTVDDVLAWVASPKGPPPGRPVGGMTGLGPNQHGYFTADLPAGEYALICFYPDAKDGKPHFMHGMKQQIKIS